MNSLPECVIKYSLDLSGNALRQFYHYYLNKTPLCLQHLDISLEDNDLESEGVDKFFKALNANIQLLETLSTLRIDLSSNKILMKNCNVISQGFIRFKVLK